MSLILWLIEKRGKLINVAHLVQNLLKNNVLHGATAIILARARCFLVFFSSITFTSNSLPVCTKLFFACTLLLFFFFLLSHFFYKQKITTKKLATRFTHSVVVVGLIENHRYFDIATV